MRHQANTAHRQGGQKQFSEVASVSAPRSTFDRSHKMMTTFDAGFLIPIFCDEVLPGDTMNLKLSTFSRMATPLTPIMDGLHEDVFFFFVPNRLLWDNWQKFMGEQTDPGDSVAFTVPQVVSDVGGFLFGSIYDHMGIVPKVDSLAVNAFHLRAYNLIYNEWFRDENLIDSLIVPTGDGPDAHDDYALVRRGKRFDYFTGCLPFPQKGAEVVLPIGGSAPIDDTAMTSVVGLVGDAIPQWEDAGTNVGPLKVDGTNTDFVSMIAHTGPTVSDLEWNDPKLSVTTTFDVPPTADLSSATAITVNALREGIVLQQMYERDARGGTRYTELIRSHFGVVSPDARLQRPEYLGGGSAQIQVNPIPQVSETGTDQLGTMGAFVTSATRGRGFTKSFVEHGVILGLMSVRADITYQQSLEKMWTRQTKLDYFLPVFANLGEQAVLQGEIYRDDAGTPATVFGYQERWAEYRYKPSLITNEFRSEHPTSLDIWHLAQDFAAVPPLLNESFINDTPPIARVVAVPTEPEFLFDAWFNYKCTRPMPVRSTPGLTRF